MRIGVLVSLMLVCTGVCADAPLAGGEETQVPFTAVVSTTGMISVWDRRHEITTIAAGVNGPGGRVDQESGVPVAGQDTGITASDLQIDEIKVRVDMRTDLEDGGLSLAYALTPSEEMSGSEVSVRLRLPSVYWHDATWTSAGKKGAIPSLYGGPAVFRIETSSIVLTTENRRLALTLSEPALVTLADNRKWGSDFTLWIASRQPREERWPAGNTRTIELKLQMEAPIRLEQDSPVTIEESDDWVPVETILDIEPGSALDFSRLGLTDPPAGKYGWLRSVGDHFEFSERPGEPMRFYGANVVWSALYLDRDECDRFADLLQRMGYNSVRIHHYERELLDPEAPDSLTFRPDSLDKLDYLFAALKERGIYSSIDLFVSRQVESAEIFPGTEGRVSNFKVLIPVSDRAFENLKEFSRRLLTHVNPYTGLVWKDDPALAFISLINEGMSLNYWDRLDDLARPLWQEAFNRWLTERYGTREAMAEAWGEALEPGQDPTHGSVPLPNTFENDRPGLDLARFCAEIHARMFRRMAHFLRDELSCRALLTDMNAWTYTLQNQYPRAEFDYADSHFYWDHPEFLRRGWRLPSKGWSGGGSAVADGGGGPAIRALTRFYNKPFTLSEYNWAYPSIFRSESGLVVGSYCSLQDYGGVWRYAFAGYREALVEPAPLSYFYFGSDPINLAAERAAVCLFLRRDVAAAKTRVGLASSRQGLLESEHVANLDARIARLGWVTQIGMSVDGRDTVAPRPDVCLPLSGDRCPKEADSRVLAQEPLSADALPAAIQALRDRGLLAEENVTDPSKSIFESETGEILLDGEEATLLVDTPRTAGAFSVDPGAVSVGPLEVETEGWGGAVWVSSLDGEPITSSGRMLLVHVTDVQNSGARFADRKRRVLEGWGELPYLARCGRARVDLTTGRADELHVWALDMSGRRVAEVESTREGGRIRFVADIRGPAGACFYYEIAAQ